MRDPHSVSHLARAAAIRFVAPISDISTLKADKALANKGNRSGGNSGGSDRANSGNLPKVRGSNVVFLFGSNDDDGMPDSGTGGN
jgi:hypothetical protein